MAEPLNTLRLGDVYVGQWAVHTPSGQIGKITNWTDSHIQFKMFASTRGTGEDRTEDGFQSSDQKDNFRSATMREVRGYVYGDWTWNNGQDVTPVQLAAEIEQEKALKVLLQGTVPVEQASLPAGSEPPIPAAPPMITSEETPAIRHDREIEAFINGKPKDDLLPSPRRILKYK
jgi:hypothetical protein